MLDEILRYTEEAGAQEIGGATLGKMVRLPEPLPGTATPVVTVLTAGLTDPRHVGELGRFSFDPEALHEAVGQELAELGLEVIVGVGELARSLCDGAEGAERGAQVLHLEDAKAAGRQVPALFHAGDRVLLKGSRRIGLEAVLEAWRARPTTGEVK